jgi:ABC-type transport system involved in multi-copper enzyme maturation permease subunit
MTFLPIVERELRVASRRRSTYWMRWAAALAALGGGIWIYALTFQETPKQTGIILFVTLAVLANFYALLAGLRTTADCLSEEKREGTLGLLFLTDLKGYDIVLGKLAATSLNAFYGLLAMFPLLGVALLMGGVTMGEFGRVVLVSVNNLLFSLAAGLFCSSVSRDDRKALAATFLLLILATGLPLIGLAVAAAFESNPLRPEFLLPSPSFTCYTAFDANYGASQYAGAFWISAVLVLGLTALMLALAGIIVPRTWQDKSPSAGRPGLRERYRQWQYGQPEVRRSLRRRMLEINPILWLTSREPFKRVLPYIGLAGLAVIWVWGLAELGDPWFESASIPTALVVHGLLKVWLTSESCRRFAEDRRSGALELLLATPLSVEEILRGQRRALWRQFAGPTLAALIADFLLMAGCLSSNSDESDQAMFLGLWSAGMVVLMWDLYALSWVGPWMGLNSRSVNRAFTSALVRIGLLPWLAYLFGLAAVAMLEFTYRWSVPDHLGPGFFIGSWFGICAVNNLFFTGWARLRLRREFREIATRRVDGPTAHGEWGRVLAEWLRGKR